MKKILIVLFLFSTILFAKEVTVSIVPQKYFVEKIAKDKVKVNVMVTPGASPATYEPKTSQMRQLSKSDIYFSIDVPFEKAWLERFKSVNKKMLIVDTDEGIKKEQIAAHHHEDENHDDHENHEAKNHDDHKNHGDEKHEEEDHHEEHKGEKHEHTGLDPHIWLDPILVKTQAKNIYEALVKIDEKNKEFYKNNLESFYKELDDLNEKLENILKPYHDKAFMVFHPSWGYFARRYDLKQIAIEIEGKEPKPAQLVELLEEAKENNIKIVFVAPQFSKKGAKTISTTIKGNVVNIDPLASNWDENLIKVANEIANSYK